MVSVRFPFKANQGDQLFCRAVDRYDKQLLPKAMQLRRGEFGKKGQARSAFRIPGDSQKPGGRGAAPWVFSGKPSPPPGGCLGEKNAWGWGIVCDSGSLFFGGVVENRWSKIGGEIGDSGRIALAPLNGCGQFGILGGHLV